MKKGQIPATILIGAIGLAIGWSASFFGAILATNDDIGMNTERIKGVEVISSEIQKDIREIKSSIEKQNDKLDKLLGINGK